MRVRHRSVAVSGFCGTGDCRNRVRVSARLNVLSGLAMACCSASSIAAPREDPAAAFHGELARMGAVSWRLRQAAGTACPNSAGDAGMVVDDLAAYHGAARAAMAPRFDGETLLLVISVAPGGPGDKAGVAAGDRLTAIGGVPIADLRRAVPSGGIFYQVATALLGGGANGRSVVVSLRRGAAERTLWIAPIRLCDVRFVLTSNPRFDGWSDAHGLAITTGLVEFTRSDDELALLAAHELAHVISRDPRRVDHRTRLALEDRADALGAQLTVCAGYSATAALNVWRRFNQRSLLRLLPDPDHRPVNQRIRMIEAALRDLSCPSPSAAR